MKRDAQAIYQMMDELVIQLRKVGCDELAHGIDYRVHKVAWTTRSELLDELQEFLAKAVNKPSQSSAEAQKLLQDGLFEVVQEIKLLSPHIRGESKPRSP